MKLWGFKRKRLVSASEQGILEPIDDRIRRVHLDDVTNAEGSVTTIPDSSQEDYDCDNELSSTDEVNISDRVNWRSYFTKKGDMLLTSDNPVITCCKPDEADEADEECIRLSRKRWRSKSLTRPIRKVLGKPSANEH